VKTLGLVSLLALALTAAPTGTSPRQAPTAAVEISSLTLVPQEVAAGSQASGNIRLNASAPGPLEVSLSSTNTAVARMPGTVVIPSRARSASFPVQTSGADAGCTRITASLNNGSARSADLIVLPQPSPRLAPVGVRLESDAVVATGSVLAFVDLPQPAAADGTIVNLASNNPAVATVPASIIVPPAATSQGFMVSTSVVGASTCAVISARVGTFTSRALLKVVGISR
jgi:hypothetical protein